MNLKLKLVMYMKSLYMHLQKVNKRYIQRSII
nr:MAG TPA: hypothetical protein [Caudoviricetes sp.]